MLASPDQSHFFNRTVSVDAETQLSALGLYTNIGKSKWELDTPALCVDLDIMERNMTFAQAEIKALGLEVRPHTKTHKCPDIAKMQVSSGAIGICTAKLSESEVMLGSGIEQVLMTGVNVTSSKIKHAMFLRKNNPGFIQTVDNYRNAKDLQDAAEAFGIIADIVVDINIAGRSGIPPGKSAFELALLVDKLPNLKFRGILAYDGVVQHIAGFENRKAKNIERIEPAVESYELMKKAGLDMGIFSGGGTGTYNMMQEIRGFTDVQIGSYLFMDHQYMIIGGSKNEQLYQDFIPSLTLMTTIVNNSLEKRLVTDAGSKALTLNQPPALVIGEPGFLYDASSDEYGIITYSDSLNRYAVGDKLEIIVPHCDPVVNLFDFIYGIRNEKIETILPILARGKSQ